MSKYGCSATGLVTVKLYFGFNLINVIGRLIAFTCGSRSFPGVKRPGRDLEQRLPSSAENKERSKRSFMSGYTVSCTFTVGD